MQVKGPAIDCLTKPAFLGNTDTVLAADPAAKGEDGLEKGIKCLIGTDQESTLGIAGQLHVGASVPNLDLPCDPMGPMLYLDSPAKERIHAESSYLTVPTGPGLGVELDEEKLRALTIASA